MYLLSPQLRNSLALLILRLFLGQGMIHFGWKKMTDGVALFAQELIATPPLHLPFPLFFAWLATLSEFIGGLFVFLGLKTRASSFLVLFVMAVAYYSRRSELALFYGMVGFVLALMGGGAFSLDQLFSTRRAKISADTAGFDSRTDPR